jgi:hypothetical protein
MSSLSSPNILIRTLFYSATNLHFSLNAFEKWPCITAIFVLDFTYRLFLKQSINLKTLKITTFRRISLSSASSEKPDTYFVR